MSGEVCHICGSPIITGSIIKTRGIPPRFYHKACWPWSEPKMPPRTPDHKGEQ